MVTALKVAGVTVKMPYTTRKATGWQRVVKDVQDTVRTNLACLVWRFGQEFAGGHPVLPWLVKYSAAMVNGCRRGTEGKTAYELSKGRKFARALPHFAEKILFMIPGITKGVARAESRWEDGSIPWCV